MAKIRKIKGIGYVINSIFGGATMTGKDKYIAEETDNTDEGLTGKDTDIQVNWITSAKVIYSRICNILDRIANKGYVSEKDIIACKNLLEEFAEIKRKSEEEVNNYIKYGMNEDSEKMKEIEICIKKAYDIIERNYMLESDSKKRKMQKLQFSSWAFSEENTEKYKKNRMTYIDVDVSDSQR